MRKQNFICILTLQMIIFMFMGCSRLVDDFEPIKWDIVNVSDSRSMQVKIVKSKSKKVNNIEISVCSEGGSCSLRSTNYTDLRIVGDEEMFENKLLSEGVNCDIKDRTLTITIDAGGGKISQEPLVFWVSAGISDSRIIIHRLEERN